MPTRIPSKSGKRIITKFEAQLLVSHLSLFTSKPIEPFSSNTLAEDFLYWYLKQVYQYQELRSFWVRYYDSQSECLTLHTPENHMIADDIYNCNIDPSRFIENKYDNVCKCDLREEAIERIESVQSSTVAPKQLLSITLVDMTNTTPSEEAVEDDDVEEDQEPQPVQTQVHQFDWNLFKTNLNANLRKHK